MTLLRCPSGDEIAAQALKLLPRGRAWQTHEVGPQPGTVLYGYWRAFGESVAHLCQRLCDLRFEFWCATQVETHNEWLAEYGLPDDCDPYPDLCAKVAAIGGASCDHYQLIAARAGWSISCAAPCAVEAGCAEAGLSTPGLSVAAGTLTIVVHAADSPAYVAALGAAEVGRLEAGERIDCDPLDPLRCLVESVIHANLLVTYHIED